MQNEGILPAFACLKILIPRDGPATFLWGQVALLIRSSLSEQKIRKRTASFLHYWDEWKVAAVWRRSYIHEIPTRKTLGVRGEDSGSSDRRSRTEPATAIFGYWKASILYIFPTLS